MSAISFDELAAAIADVVQKQLVRGHDVRVEGLGTFSLEHRNSEMQEQPDGQIVMHPPSDLVVFTPEG